MGGTRKRTGKVTILPAEKAARPHRYRSDGWSPRKRQQFLEVLRQEASITEAARAVRLSKTSVTRLRDKDPDFDRECEDALSAMRPSLMETAYQRAVFGTKEPVFHGGKQVGTRRKTSDAMLRLLIDRGVDPNHASGFGSGRTVAGRPIPTNEEVLAALDRKLTAIEKSHAGRRAAADGDAATGAGTCAACGGPLRLIAQAPVPDQGLDDGVFGKGAAML